MSMQNMHKVVVYCPSNQLGELTGWVATLHGAVVASTELMDQEAALQQQPKPVVFDRAKAIHAKYGVAVEPDPRLVFHPAPDGGRPCINVDASLLKLGLTKAYLQRNPPKRGTPEHSVKMAMCRSYRNGSGKAVGPANLNPSTHLLENRKGKNARIG